MKGCRFQTRLSGLQEPKSRCPNSGLKYSYGVDHGTVRWMSRFWTLTRLSMGLDSFPDPQEDSRSRTTNSGQQSIVWYIVQYDMV